MKDTWNPNIGKILLSCILFLLMTTSCNGEHTVTLNDLLLVTATHQPSFTPHPAKTTMAPPPSETLTPTPSEPTIATDPSFYYLATPDPSVLLSMIADIHQFDVDAREKYDDQEVIDSIEDESVSLANHLDFELKRHYPNGLPDPQLALKFSPWGGGFPLGIPQIFPHLVEEAIVSSLNEENTELNDGKPISGPDFKADVHVVEIDGDPDPEWYLKVTSPDLGSIQWILIDEENGTYEQLISGPEPTYIDWTGNITYDLIALSDLTGDALTDAIVLYTYFFMERQTMVFYVLQGKEDGFHHLSTIDEFVRTQSAQYVDYELSIAENATASTLKLNVKNDLNWDCYWTSVTTYNWAGGIEHKTISDENPPDTPECLLAQVINEFNVEPIEHIPLLEHALDGFTNAESGNADLTQLARYRLGLLYALQDQDYKAKQHLQTFLDNYTSGDFEGSELATYLGVMRPLLDVAEIDPLALCKVTYDHPEKFTGWEYYIRLVDLFPGNTFMTEPFPLALCPVNELVLQMLERVPFDPSSSPKDNLLSANIPTLVAISYPLQNYPTPAWYIYVNSDLSVIYGYLPDNSSFHWEIILAAQDPILNKVAGEPSWYTGDSTGDGRPEIAFLIPQTTEVCEAGETYYQIFIITCIGGGKGFSSTNYFCLSDDEVENHSTFLDDLDGDGLVDWIMDKVKYYSEDLPGLYEKLGSKELVTGDDLWNAKMELEEETVVQERNFDEDLFNGEDPAQIRIKLEESIEALNKEGPIFDLKFQHYSYLIALSYELEENFDEALIAFHQLARMEVKTLWRDLATARLALK